MLRHKPDIFFSPANILPFFTPKKSFATIHDIGFVRFSECYGTSERRLQTFGTKRAIKKSSTIFVPSEFTKKELIEIYGADAEKIAVTPLGYDVSSPSPSNSPSGRGRISGSYFLFIGRKDAKKNIAGIINAFKIFSEKNSGYSLVLAGPGSLNIQYLISNIYNLDWINPQEKQNLLQNAEAFLFPSFYEGFGLPILEAMAAGAPVITSNCASMPEVSGDAALLIDPKNPQEIADAMERIIKNPALKAELIERGGKRLDNFSWEKCAKDTSRILFSRQN